MDAELNKVREWARGKLAAGQELPWAWYQYMKLVEAVDAILAGRQATKESSQQSESPPATNLRLVASRVARYRSIPSRSDALGTAAT